MNIFTGIIRLDNQPIDERQLQRAAFISPYWQPDHQTLFLQGPVGIVSTQRFITPECAHAPLPYCDPVSGCVIVADVYLTNHAALAAKLGQPVACSDAGLILAAYLRFGQECTKHLAGKFCFALWDQRQNQFLLAVDHLGLHPCLYSYQAGAHFIFSNHMAGMRALSPTLDLDETIFAYFSLDSTPKEHTCYLQVKKVLPAHQWVITPPQVQQQCYWRLTDQHVPLPYKTRADCYEAFQELFSSAVAGCLPTTGAVTTHISGGLDSSSVTAMAARQLAQRNQKLYSFTAIPNGLDGPSYRPNWFYHEMPRVQAVLDQYQNIEHYIYRASPDANIFSVLKALYPYIDQPIRNVTNMDWIFASLRYAQSKESRVLLTGQMGNATISYAGRSLRNQLGSYYRAGKLLLRPINLFDGFFNNLTPEFLHTTQAKSILRKRGMIINPQYATLAGLNSAARQTSLRPIYFWHGVESLDPTADLSLVDFCCRVPHWVFHNNSVWRKNDVLQQRLLVREGLTGVLPEAVRVNPYRGEQGADWLWQYNRYAAFWRQQLHAVDPQHFLWQYYDREKNLNIFGDNQVPLAAPTNMNVKSVALQLMRCLSAAQFADSLQQH